MLSSSRCQECRSKMNNFYCLLYVQTEKPLELSDNWCWTCQNIFCKVCRQSHIHIFVGFDWHHRWRCCSTGMPLFWFCNTHAWVWDILHGMMLENRRGLNHNTCFQLKLNPTQNMNWYFHFNVSHLPSNIYSFCADYCSWNEIRLVLWVFHD